MTLTGHWNRAWERPYHIETRDGLLREERKWEDALDRFADVVNAYPFLESIEIRLSSTAD
jgi:hypothetical protein